MDIQKLVADYLDMDEIIDGKVTKQLPIDDTAIRRLFEVRLGIFYNDVGSLAEQVYTGDISLSAWETSMRQYIKEIYTSAGAMAKGGWDNVTQSDWGKLGADVKKQYKFLHGFAQDIAENRDTIALGTIQARANMYGNSAGSIIIKLSVDGEILSKLPWIPKDGSTECLVNCKCVWVLKVLKRTKKFQEVFAVWRLRPAEHCGDCVDRANYKLTFKVPPTIQVPEYIGGY